MQYWYKGVFKSLTSVDIALKVKGESDHTFTVYRSVYGPVIKYDASGLKAYSKKRGWDGKEIKTLMAWNKLSTAKNWNEWKQYAKDSAINVNLYYADKKGNIGYALGGHYPVRQDGHDNRLPSRGDGLNDWLGIYPFSTNPQVYNPKSGYIFNWNNRPSEGVINSGLFWYSWSHADRGVVIEKELKSQSTFTSKEAWGIIENISFKDPNAYFYIPYLLPLLKGKPEYKAIYKILSTWSYADLDDNKDGLYDNPATVIFRSYLTELLIQFTKNGFIPKAQQAWFQSPEYHKFSSLNLSSGSKLLARWLENPKKYSFIQGIYPQTFQLAVFNKVVKDLETSQGENPKLWRQPVTKHHFSYKNFLKIPQANPEEAYDLPLGMNRGAENNMTVFSKKGVHGFEVIPSGQSGFISSDEKKSVHYNDQSDIFNNFELKNTWLSIKDVDENTMSTEVIKVTRPL